MAAGDAIDVNRVRYVTERYAQLRGLRLVPPAFCFVASAAWRAGLLGWLPWIDGKGARAYFFGGLAIAVIASSRISRAYRRHIGDARPRVGRTGVLTLTASCGLLFLFTLLPSRPGSVSIAAVFAACALACLGLFEERRRHYLIVSGASLLFALMPVLGVPPAIRDVALDLLIGGGLIVAGLGDHLVLRRTLQGGRDARAA
jgi:hypothetical protein